MNRPPFLGVAIAAAALLVMSAGTAHAKAPAPLPFGGVDTAEPPALPVEPAPAVPEVVVPEVPTGGTVVTLPVVPGPVVTDPVVPDPVVPDPVAVDPVAPAPVDPVTPVEPPATNTDPAAPDEIGAADPSLEIQPVETETAKVTATQADAPVTDGRAIPGGASGGEPPAATGSGVILEQLLPGVERQLRGVETQMNDLQRRLAGGATPGSESLVRLRRSLELIAPALAALGAHDIFGRLSPELRELLQRVQAQLGSTNATAAELAAALRRAGVRGPELALLMRELERFQALGPSLAPDLQLTASQPLYATPDVAYTDNLATPVAPATPVASGHEAGSSQRRAASAPAAAPAQPSGSYDLLPQTAASGSASAGPGGAFSAAGLAGLAALLGTLLLPRLLSRVQLPLMRCYAAVFLVPLQRPG